MKLAGQVLLTGGSGYLGRAILRRAEREHWNARFTIYSRDEHKQAAVKRRFPDIRCVLGDVRDLDRLQAVMPGHDVVVHAAAVKFIPEAEFNVLETIDVNVEGSRIVAMAAASSGVGSVVGISTDKAAAPLNTYGLTKALMERVFGEAASWGITRFSCVRYGNVVSSSGSVVRTFRRQLQEDGRVQVTHADMTRFWLSADEAVDLIATANALAGRDPGFPAGGVLVPRCAAMAIIDLARVVAGEAPVDVVGLRPGEKMHETLATIAEIPRIRQIDDERPLGVIAPAYVPAGSVPDRSAWRSAYSSHNPDAWLAPAQMAALIADADDLENLCP